MFTLSIVLNLHREGDLSAKTIDNLKNILVEPHNWEDVEIIAVLDNPDVLTKNIVQKHNSLFSKVEEVDYRDLGDSRNHGVDASTNEFIVFADGDDYCSHNMLQALYERFFKHYSHYKSTQILSDLREEDHIAIFPECLVEFPNLFQMHYVDSNEYIVKNNRFVHCYHSKISASRWLLKKHRIRANTPPYGYEDWDLNNRLLSTGVHYKTAKYTLYYRRESSQSLLQKQTDSKHIVRNSELYSYGRSLKPIEKSSNVSNLNPFLFQEPQSNAMKHVYQDVLFEKDRLFLESYNEKLQYRADVIISSTTQLAATLSLQSETYDQLLDFLQDKEIIYFVPWINLGGADKVIVEYTKSIETRYKAGLITSINSGSRIDRLNIPFYDLTSRCETWDHLSIEDKLHIITKAVINSKIKIVHIINSDIALQTLKYYANVYKEHQVKTIATFFCPDYDWTNKQYHGYPVMYPEIFENTDMVLSDNNYWYTYFKTLNKDRDFKFKKLASPTDEIEMKFLPKGKSTKKILWASRICNQKLFDVFETIVHALPQYQFVIYGGQPEEENNKEILNRLLTQANVEFRGEYQHIDELDLNEFDLYLFTSLFEGIPTIILDMAMLGIPIVSTDVGGISEVLGKKYPLLVKEPQNAEEYIEKINYFYEHTKDIHNYMQKVHDYIAEHHNEHTFQKDYRQVIEGILDDHR